MTEDRGESLRMIRDSAAGLAPRTGDLRRIRALRFTEPGFDREVWRQMCEMGWPGLLVSEDFGGSGLGVQEFCALTEELGASLVPEPLIAAAFAAMLLPADHLGAVLSGDRIVLPAWQEKPHSIDLVGDASREFGAEEGTRVLAARSPRPDLKPDAKLPDDTRLWAALQRASGGTWGGCVYDVDRIIRVLENALKE